MKVYLEYISDGKRVLLGEGDSLDKLDSIKLAYLNDNYKAKRYYDRHWISNGELICDFGSHSQYIIYSELDIETLKESPVEE